MTAHSGLSTDAPTPGQEGRRRVFKRPGTRLGWWAAALAATFIVLFAINSAVFMQLKGDAPWQHTVLPFYGLAMLACGLAAGIAGLIAVIRQHERSWLVWLAMLPMLLVLFLLLGEFLVPH